MADYDVKARCCRRADLHLLRCQRFDVRAALKVRSPLTESTPMSAVNFVADASASVRVAHGRRPEISALHRKTIQMDSFCYIPPIARAGRVAVVL